jgi:guanylate kinase
MTRVESWKAMKEYLERPSTKMEIARLKKAREEYRAEKEKQYQLINEKAATARRVTNARKQVQAEAAKDPELKATLDKLNINSTPAQTPTPAPSTPSVSP